MPLTPLKIKQAKKQNIEQKPENGIRLSGYLSAPKTASQHPAVVLLHGCGGIWRWNEVWSQRLVNWGYVVLDVDSFTPRNKTSVCETPWQIPSYLRALDAHGAKSYLSKLPIVDPNRIAVMGMSHGGWGTLLAVDKRSNLKLKVNPFGAAIALYPWCEKAKELDAPLLILIGQQDDWSPVERCRQFASGINNSDNLTLRVYPEAHHVFDLSGIDSINEGHILRHHPQAAQDAVKRIKAFLEKHL